MKPKTVKRMCKCNFTAEELINFRDELVSAIHESHELEDEKKAVASNYKAKMDEQKATINRLAGSIKTGYEHREVMCRVEYDYERRVKSIIRMDTDELVAEEILSMVECQQEIPGLEVDQVTQVCPNCQTENPEEKSRIEDADSEDKVELFYLRCSECGTESDDVTDRDELNEIWLKPEEEPDEATEVDTPEKETNELILKDDFLNAMVEATDTNKGRTIISKFTKRLNELQVNAGVDPVCGDLNNGGYRGFSTLTKKEINAVCKAVSAADPRIGVIHTAIVEQWTEMNDQFNKFYNEENSKAFEGLEDYDGE